ncbi:MAG: transposase [Nanoarchaeota archaeon]|nr:transposase [Nanoarchaeota archaeon]MBU4124342.1 transposase [Nanoarchaeota archaeon]
MNSMMVAKTVRCRVINLTKSKLNALNEEWSNFQDFIELEKRDLDWIADKIPIRSVYKCQARWISKRIKHKFAMSLSNQVMQVKKTDNKLSKCWIKVPVKSKWGGIWLPVEPHCEFPDDYKIGESKIIKKTKGNKEWFEIYVVVKKEVQMKSCSNIITVDIGEKVMATVLFNGRPIFMGTKIRGIRRHYSWLRKRLGNKKLLKKVKQVGHKEQNKVNQILQDISNEIAVLATKTDSVIVIGDLKDIRKSAKKKGKRFNRIVNNMPHLKLTQLIEHKASWSGIPVIRMNEHGTSKTCSRCSEIGIRKNQGLFICKNCGYQVNADYNATKNMYNRSMKHVFVDGVVLQPKSCLEQQAQEVLI